MLTISIITLFKNKQFKISFTHLLICLLIFSQVSVYAGLDDEEVETFKVASPIWYKVSEGKICDIQSGECGESFAKSFFTKAGLSCVGCYQETKLPGNRGVDLIFQDNPNKVIVLHESKYLSNSLDLQLSMTQTMGQQLSRQWLAENTKELQVGNISYINQILEFINDGYILVRTANVSSVNYSQEKNIAQLYGVYDTTKDGNQEIRCTLRPEHFIGLGQNDQQSTVQVYLDDLYNTVLHPSDVDRFVRDCLYERELEPNYLEVHTELMGIISTANSNFTSQQITHALARCGIKP